MKLLVMIAGVAGAAIVYAAASRPVGTTPMQPADEIDQSDAIAYGVGYFLGDEVRTGLAADGVEVNLERVAQGFIDGLQSHGAAYDPDTLDAIFEAVHEEMQARRVAALLESDADFRELAEANAARSEAFANANAQRAGVSELFEGVHYEVLDAGEGDSAADATNVVLTFEATTIDGTPFLGGAHEEIDLGEIREIPRQIVRRMRAGDHWRVVIDHDKAFGPAGLPPQVGPNEAIVIDVTLEEVH
jgi:FKBP-type peptidyl-prolyl cis-trans isomerase FklB